MRKRIYEVISASDGSDTLSSIYDFFMIAVILVSILPLAFKQPDVWLEIADPICAGIFAVDYLLRWLTADFKLGQKRAVSFLRYPVTPMALVDLLSLLPSITLLNRGFKLLRLLRMFRALRVLRVFKLFRYSKNAIIIANIFKKQKGPLGYVLILALGYIVISALIVFNVEPDSFQSFFEAIYWATVSLTTMGYGDIYPVTAVGRIVTMVSSVFGIAIVALPAGIITAGYLDELAKLRGDESKEK